ncbi:MAG: DcaP family trimeric outer membrane transporter [Pseudomonadota bacterium]
MISKKPIAAALLALSGSCVSSTLAAGEMEDRIAALEAQLAALKAEVADNKTSISSNAEDIEEARPMAKGTKFTYGGFVQMDANVTSYSEGKPGNAIIEDLLVASLIPTETTSGDSSRSYSSTNVHAKSSRFFFKTATETDVGKISSHIELDFILSGDDGDERISNSWNSRLRHAYVKWDYSDKSSLLAGQTWSTFFNVRSLPDLIDFVGPVGTIFDRQAMLRWTTGGLQLAIENPATRLNQSVEGGLVTNFDDFHEGIPDLVARYNGNTGDLNWSIAGIVRELSFDQGDGEDDSKLGYGLSLSGKWNLGQDDLRFQLNYGDALGRYLGLNAFNDGYVDDDGEIQTFNQYGGFIAYRHFWSPKWRSTLSLSAIQADNPSAREFAPTESLAKRYETLHANLNYLPTPKMAIGGEFIYGHKELEDGRDGDLTRLQFAVKYAF